MNKMAPDISALSEFQITLFFQNHPDVTQQLCDEIAEQLTGEAVTPTLCQGGSSYTTENDQAVVQFRDSKAALDMKMLDIVETYYQDFAPRHQYRGELGDSIQIYMMNNIGGDCMYLARDELQNDNYRLLRATLDDYARCGWSVGFRCTMLISGYRFFASAYKRPTLTTQATHTLESTEKQLILLRESLPTEFRSTLDMIIAHVQDIFVEDWPIVPNHTDLFENNIHVDKMTGKITGICDWMGCEISPFGMSLGWVEIVLGTLTTRGDFWRYHKGHRELRQHFWYRLCHHMGGISAAQARRIEIARLIGLFLSQGFEGSRPAAEGAEQLGFLRAAVGESLNTSVSTQNSLIL